MNNKIGKYSILILLALLFLAPGFGAYYFYQHPSFLGTSKLNKGLLLNPPLKLNAFDKGKWKLILWNPKACDKACLQQMDSLLRIRLALGRKFYELSLWLVLNRESPSLEQGLKKRLQQEQVYVKHLTPQKGKRLGEFAKGLNLFIVNPDNYLILGYAQGCKPDDIYKDLKLLLNSNQYKSD